MIEKDRETQGKEASTGAVPSGKGKGISLESKYPLTTHVLQTLPPLAVGAQQPATIDPTLDLCTRYPLRLGGPRQCGIQSLPDTSAHGQHWE